MPNKRKKNDGVTYTDPRWALFSLSCILRAASDSDVACELILNALRPAWKTKVMPKLSKAISRRLFKDAEELKLRILRKCIKHMFDKPTGHRTMNYAHEEK
jgi:hypothetical protein